VTALDAEADPWITVHAWLPKVEQALHSPHNDYEAK